VSAPKLTESRCSRIGLSGKQQSRRRYASRRETGGVGGCGTLKEDGPVTREAHVVLWQSPGNGEPVTHSDAPLEANDPVAGSQMLRCTE
jgi:hypothetical protein